ncbi:hypothetical protein EG68_11084 [Paragonimus skrjabini miyazakii]|uniref:F-box domain-containing protein n=1 Tax=Paragonimus skrjabini miyazakii TaxID=59628 RepID=A0A8S9YF49_9TREM|nr:hypothetical protein EG68_11084 [Paragonimus skrjabini miyazakii]
MRRSHRAKHVNPRFIINELPDELLHRIFKWLTPRELCIAAAVCKRWNLVCGCNAVWKSTFLKYVQKTGLRWTPTAHPVVYKELTLKHGRSCRDRLLSRMLSHTLDCRKHINLKKITLSVALVILDEDNIVLGRACVNLPSELANHHCEISLDLSTVDIVTSRLKTVILYCVIPLFLEECVTCSNAPRQFIQMRRFSLMFDPYSCSCDRFTSQKIARVHDCAEGLLIGQWDFSSLAFVSCPYTLADICDAFKAILPLRSIRWCNISGSKKVDSDPGGLFNLSAFLVGTNGMNRLLVANTWRSFDIKRGHVKLIHPSERASHVPFEHQTVMNVKVGEFQVTVKDALVLRFLVFRQDDCLLFNFRQCVLLKSSPNEVAQFGEEEGTRFRFTLKEQGSILTGLVLRNPKSKLDKLIELELYVT